MNAIRACLSMTNRLKPTPFYACYGKGGLAAEARRPRRDLNRSGFRRVDLRTCKPDGTPRHLSLAEHRQEALDLIETEDPDSIIAGPPRTHFSSWQNLNHSNVDPNRAKKCVKDARKHVKCDYRLYRGQVDAGNCCLHEHPFKAPSRQVPGTKNILQAPGVGTTTAHQCMRSLATMDGNGQPTLARTPTSFMSNSPCVLAELTRLCAKDHPHQQLTDGPRKPKTRILYPPCAPYSEGCIRRHTPHRTYN